MNKENRQAAYEFLQKLVNQPLCYGLKFQDMDLFDFGFGKLVEVVNYKNQIKKMCLYTLHVTCSFKVITKKGELHVDGYDENTPSDIFASDIKRLLGLRVQRVALSDKNDLWVDFGDYWMVFITFEHGEESWRFFNVNPKRPHLVASNLQLDF